MQPFRLTKALALAFLLGALLRVGTDPTATRQLEAMAVANAQAIAISAMQSVGNTLGDWMKQAANAALKELAKQFTNPPS